MASGCVRQLFNPTRAGSQLQFFLPQLVPHRSFVFISWDNRRSSKLPELCQHHRNLTAVSKALSETDGITQADDDDGVSLGTMKLPLDTDIPRFETLLFQWANSLCQGANLPLPTPLKVDKIPNGARLGFITIGDGMTEVLVYIDCLVFPAPDGTGPIFRAVRNGPLKDQSPPGEPRIMRSLLGALKKSVEIARI
ncbi:uncharacterized protein LOC132293269 isoform X1 [Cornus florida]|uniref:uncharacterized protein LOC132293269 isoform X1 n=1 Tax=Cornus florida TaxID=4283 RepID=UPI00289D005F|nr:uncharacterized protein LOC132293269 isoform X1 [Cornus florida]